MRKLTQKHKSNINTTMLADLQHFVSWWVTSNTSYLRDATQLLTALSTFNSTSNVQQLYITMRTQDTFVREYVANTMHYITKNKLV